MERDSRVYESMLWDESVFFKRELVPSSIYLQKSLPGIYKILSAIVEPEILKVRIIDTIKGYSGEGEYLSGKMGVFELKLKQKIIYAADDGIQSIHLVENEAFHCSRIVIPQLVEGTDPGFLLKSRNFAYEVNVEDLLFKKTGLRSVILNACLNVKMFLLPAYQLCYSLHKNCRVSSIHVTNEQSTKNTVLLPDRKSRNAKPKWSPSGSDIAFFSDFEGKIALYAYSLKTGTINRITSPSLSPVGSFDWHPDADRLAFTCMVNSNREIFLVDKSGTQPEQLTHGKNIYHSFMPRFSPDGNKTAFLRSLSGITDLWICNNNGTDLRKITECGYIKGFNWLMEGKALAFIKTTDGRADELYMLNTGKPDAERLGVCDSIIGIRGVCAPNNGTYISFIGSTLSTEDIFVYDMENEKTTNMTNHKEGVKIGDFVWKPDSSKIYYSSNEAFYYNVYSISLASMDKKQLTNTTAVNIELTYRPRIE